MSDINVIGVDFVALQTRDHAAAAKFYGETLGLPFVKSWGKMPASEFQAGNLTLAVMQSDAFGLEFAPSSTMVALAVDDDLEDPGGADVTAMALDDLLWRLRAAEVLHHLEVAEQGLHER